jgi:hypothetical protein
MNFTKPVILLLLNHITNDIYALVRCSPNFLLMNPFWLQKITTDPHIPALVSIECLDDRHPKFKICISELILDSYQYIPLAYVTTHCVIRP